MGGNDGVGCVAARNSGGRNPGGMWGRGAVGLQQSVDDLGEHTGNGPVFLAEAVHTRRKRRPDAPEGAGGVVDSGGMQPKKWRGFFL